MNDGMAGYAGRGGTWRGMPAMRALASAAVVAVALSGCSLGRTAPQAQLFDLGPAPDLASAPASAPAALSPSVSRSPSASRSSSASALPDEPRDGSPASTGSPRPGRPGSPVNGAPTRREPVAVSFSAAQMLTDTGVIWRVGDSASPHSYATYRWAAPPSQLVQQRIVDRLSATGPVVQDGVDPRAPVLQVTLTRFEQVYAPDGKSSSGQVALQAVLVRERRVVDSVRLARSAPAPTLDAQGGVVALRAATDTAAADLAAWLERSLQASAATSAPTPASASSTASENSFASFAASPAAIASSSGSEDSFASFAASPAAIASSSASQVSLPPPSNRPPAAAPGLTLRSSR